MAKDYAKYGYKKRAANEVPRRWEWVIVILLVLVIGSAIAWAGIHKMRTALAQDAHVTSILANLQGFFHHKKKDNELAQPAKVMETSQEEDEVHFDFYNELPNMQMATSSNDADKSNSTKTSYILRLAVFKDLNSAKQMRISLLLAGIDADIVKVGQSYRVQQGSYPNASQAKSMQQQLQKKGIDAVIEKV
jgi:cell division septation protein DedD